MYSVLSHVSPSWMMVALSANSATDDASDMYESSPGDRLSLRKISTFWRKFTRDSWSYGDRGREGGMSTHRDESEAPE